MSMMRVAVLAAVAAGVARADPETFNSASPAENAQTRAMWLAACGIQVPQHLVDFETGFADGENITGVGGLFPAGLVITDTSPDMEAIVTSGTMGGSNPIGVYALSHHEKPYLELDFSASPVDFVALQDIDTAGTTIVLTFADDTTFTFSIETTATGGDSAEFVGVWRNDMPPIARVEMDASGDGTWGIDNIEYGFTGCAADCNVDGLLNILDFVCFQGLFTQGDPGADCNADGVLNILDFVCFQGLFQTGCP
jgi:hypothetical protein